MFDPDNDRYWKFVLAIVLRLSIYMVFLRNKNVEESFHRFIVLMHFEKYVSALKNLLEHGLTRRTSPWSINALETFLHRKSLFQGSLLLKFRGLKIP